jgi:hypothetical protein
VPNPAHVNEKHARRAAKHRKLQHPPRPRYLWKEVMGRNRVEDKFLYVTDGGHYENLGLVELLRRGCRSIYCFDAGGGTSSSALGDAISLARSELDVEIEMLPETAMLDEDPATQRAARCCARGRIVYPPRDGQGRVEGTLFYVRSVLTEDGPWELRSFQGADSLFPHHSTFDQFFDDQRFEAYRLLGATAAERALGLERLHRCPATPPRPPVVRREPQLDASGNGAAPDEPAVIPA